MNITRKILAPLLFPTILRRERLAQALEEALKPPDPSFLYHLVLLCAPAGYGKTTLLVDTVKHVSLPCCWYILDHADLDINTFFKTLLASIRQRFPNFGPHLDALLAEGTLLEEGPIQTFLDALITALETDLDDHCILVLCDYQKVNSNSTLNRIISQLLKRLPSQCLVVIESRALPDLELASFIIKHEICVLGESSLRFSAQDVCDLAQVQGLPPLSKEEATQLATTFDGWITGILLGSRLGSARFGRLPSSPEEVWTPPTLYANRHQLFASVIEEIFRDEATIYTFLKHTSLLDRLTPALCDTLLETSNAEVLLAYTERQGLFLRRDSSDKDVIYRCHPTVREILQEELRCQEPERYCMLHKQGAMLFYGMHEYAKAITYALKAKAYDLAARIVLEASPRLCEQGQSDVILSCLDALPDLVIQKDPRLLLLRVNMYLRQGHAVKARLPLACAEAAFQTFSQQMGGSNGENALISAELAIARSKLSFYQGDYRAAQQHLQQVLDVAPLEERALRMRVHLQIGICTLYSGEPVAEGIVQFQKVLHLCHPGEDESAIRETHHYLAKAYEWAGNYTVAEHHRRCICASQEHAQQQQEMVENLIGMGSLKMRQGLLEEAEALFQQTLHVAQQSPCLLSSEAYALLAFGELELTRLNFQAALLYLEKALMLARQLEDRYVLNSTLHTLALVYIRMGECHTAQCLLDHIMPGANEVQSCEGMSALLVRGTLLLAQQQYSEARTKLEKALRLAREAGIQWLHIQAFARLAACYLAMGQRTQAQQLLKQTAFLTLQEKHDYTLQVELQAYQMLQPLGQEMTGENEAPQIEVMGSQERLRMYALGEPLVVIDSTPVTHWRMSHALELYFFLLEHNQQLRKDQIITALWPESDDSEQLNQTFRSTVFYLRQAIGKACLIQRSGLYRLDLQTVYGPFWYDVSIFQEQQRIATAALEEEDDQSAAQAFQRMVDLYRGDYVQAFYSDWCIPQRDKLRQALMDALQQLALIAWRSEEYEESLQHWQHLLIIDSCLEKAHYGVMRCYLRQGKRDLALRQYHRCSQELYNQLHVKPGQAIQKLYLRIAEA